MSSRYDSISDDALFGSGTDSWNLNSSSSPLLPRDGNIINDMTLQNQDESRNRTNGRPRQEQVLHPLPDSSRATNDMFHAVYDPDPVYPLPASRQVTIDTGARIDNGARIDPGPRVDTGARAKVLKNKENKNKNNTKRTQVMKNGENKVVPQQFRPRDRTSDWQPVLQLKQYDDDDETALLKPVNNSKHKKQNKNKNTPTSKSAPLTTTSSFSDNDMLSLESIPMPAGLNPNSRPQDIVHRLYLPVKDNNRLQNGLEGPSYRGNEIANSMQREHQTETLPGGSSHPQNVTSIYNNLWEEPRRGKKKSNEDTMSVVHLNTSNGEAVHVVNNDLENQMNMLPQQQETAFTDPRHLPRTHSASGLDNQIVVPYHSQNKHTIHMENLACNAETSPGDNVPAMTFNSSSNSLPNSLLVDKFDDSLSSSLSSNVLFGDGNYTNDFLLAQQLQRKYDRENEEIQRQRQFDLPSTVHRSNVAEERPVNRQQNVLPQPLVTEDTESLQTHNAVDDSISTLEYVTAFPTFDNSLTYDGHGESVYVPEEITQQAHPSETIVIPIENSRDHNGPRQEEETERVSEPQVVTIPCDRIQNDEIYPGTVSLRENIHIPLEEDSGISNFTRPCEEPAGNIVARGSRSPRQQDDSEMVARLLQEQQDEELARQLQEDYERRSQSHFVGRNNTRSVSHHRPHRNSEPLRQRFSDTWTRRPLIVPTGALNNNTADGQIRRPYTSSERPLVTRNGNEFSYLDNVHSIPINEGYDIPPGHDYYYRYENDPDYMLDEPGEDRLISINRDPQLLATLLMTRDPNMMIPNDVDLNDYEALWELAEDLGEVRRVGMDHKDISLLPVHVHEASKKDKSDDDKIDCLVCLSEFKSGERLKTLPCCHIYHVNCIDEWLKRNAVCPVCRRSAKQGDN